MKFLCFLSAGRWEHNAQRAARDRFCLGMGWDAAAGANRSEFCPAPSTDSLRNFSSSQSNLSSSASSFCRLAPADICPPFIKHIEIYRWKPCKYMKYYWSKLRLLWKPVRGKLEEEELVKTKWTCPARAEPCAVTGLCPQCSFMNDLDQECFPELANFKACGK